MITGRGGFAIALIALATVLVLAMSGVFTRGGSFNLLLDQYAGDAFVAQRSGINLRSGDGLAVPSSDAPLDSRVDYTFEVDLLASGSDGDSTTTKSDSGLEFVGGDLTLLRGCLDAGLLAWDEATDAWECAPPAVGGGGALFRQKLDPVLAGSYSVPGWYFGDTQNETRSTGVLAYVPIFVGEATTYDQMAIRVTSGSSGASCRLGIYEWDAGSPGDLVLDAGAVSVASTGLKTISISQTLVRGYYFLAFVCDGSPGLRVPGGNDAVSAPVQGYNTDGDLEMVNLVPIIGGRSGDVAAGLSDPAVAPTSIESTGHVAVRLRE